MAMADELHGGCQCGALRYVARPSAGFRPYACHCTDCQSQTGSAFALHVWLLAGDLEIQGDCVEGRQARPGGATLSIYACPQCFSRIYSSNSARPQVVTLRIGTRDDSAQFTPDFHIWTRSKQPWIVLPDGAPSYYAQPASAEEWLKLMRGQA